MIDLSRFTSEFDEFAKSIGCQVVDEASKPGSQSVARYFNKSKSTIIDLLYLDNKRVPTPEEIDYAIDTTKFFTEIDNDIKVVPKNDEQVDDEVRVFKQHLEMILKESNSRICMTKELMKLEDDSLCVLFIIQYSLEPYLLLKTARFIIDLIDSDHPNIDCVVVCAPYSIVRDAKSGKEIKAMTVPGSDPSKLMAAANITESWIAFFENGGHSKGNIKDLMRDRSEALNDDPPRFKLSQKSYLKTYRKVYNNLGLNVSSIFQTSLKLPFHLPLDYKYDVTFSVDHDSAVTVILHRIKTTEFINIDLEDYQPKSVEVLKTFAEVVYATNQDMTEYDADPEKVLNKVFALSIEKLNKIIVSYQVTTKDFRAYRITLNMLEPFCRIRAIEPHSWKIKDTLFPLNTNVPFNVSALSHEEVESIVWYANVLDKNWNPFMLSSELIVNADRNLAIGQYREAVINIQSGFESFIMILAQELNKADKLSLTDLESKFVQNGLTSILKSEFHSRLGGYWDLKDKSKPIGQWYAVCYELRNKVVHTGYMPTHSETEMAFIACKNLIQEIIACLKNKQKKYPDIARYLVVSIVDENGEVIQHASDVIFGLSKDITDKPNYTQVN